MEIYGLGLVAFSMFLGSFIGRIVGQLVGIGGDIGGVGFAMLFMILYTNFLDKKGKPIAEKTGKGILLLSSLYIPIVVAMSSIQNMATAFEQGAVAIVAGVLATLGGLLLVPVMSKLGGSKEE